jgi:hypothetical protein
VKGEMSAKSETLALKKVIPTAKNRILLDTSGYLILDKS